MRGHNIGGCGRQNSECPQRDAPLFTKTAVPAPLVASPAAAPFPDASDGEPTSPAGGPAPVVVAVVVPLRSLSLMVAS